MKQEEIYLRYLELKDASDLSEKLIGRIALTEIARGPAQSANLGYYIDQQYNGKGYATVAVLQCIKKAFHDYKLHRVQAGVMPKNKRSIRVLEKAGFREIGLAKHYININGVWEDHLLFELTEEQLKLSQREE